MASEFMAEAVAQQAAKLNFQQVEQMQVSCECCMMLSSSQAQFIVLWNMQLQPTPADACKCPPRGVPPKERWLDCTQG